MNSKEQKTNSHSPVFNAKIDLFRSKKEKALLPMTGKVIEI